MKIFDIETARKVLEDKFGGQIAVGVHTEPDETSCDNGACVRELRSYILEDKWGDIPDSVDGSPTDYACQVINDCCVWSCPTARTEGCLPLVLLTEENAAEDWAQTWLDIVSREFLPDVIDLLADQMQPKDEQDKWDLKEAAKEFRTRDFRVVFELKKSMLHRCSPILYEAAKTLHNAHNLLSLHSVSANYIGRARGACAAACMLCYKSLDIKNRDCDEALKEYIRIMIEVHGGRREKNQIA